MALGLLGTGFFGALQGAGSPDVLAGIRQQVDIDAKKQERLAAEEALRQRDLRLEELKRAPGMRAAKAAEGLIASRNTEINASATPADDEGNPLPKASIPEREKLAIKAGALEKEGLISDSSHYYQRLTEMDRTEAQKQTREDEIASRERTTRESIEQRREAAKLAAETKAELARMNIDSRELIAAAGNETRAAIAAIVKSQKSGEDRVLLHQTVTSIDRDITHNQDAIKQLRAANKELIVTGDKAQLQSNNDRIAELETANGVLTASKYEFLRSAGVKVPESAVGATPPRKPEAPLTLPSKQKDLITGKVYQTARGPARWNGTAFESMD